jgi:lipopolysaccharide exporter
MGQLVGVKVIFLARTVILARLLAPDDFGLLAVSLIAVDVLQRITNLGMVPALIQRQDAGDNHYAVAWTAGVIRAVIVAAVVFLVAPVLAVWFGQTRAAPLIRVVALQPVLEALASIRVAEITRDLQFRRLALIALPEALVNTVVSITLAKALGVWALVAGALAGEGAYLVMSYVLAPYRPRLVFSLAAARPLVQFGRWIFAIGLVTIAGSTLLQVVISRTLGAADLGLYVLAARLAFIPAEVSGEVIGAVAFPLYARIQTKGPELVRTFRVLYTGMLALLAPVCLLLLVLAPSLVANLLGPRWDGSVPLIQLLALVSLLGLLGDSIAPILQGVGRPDWLVVIEAVQSSVLILAVWMLSDRYRVVSAGLAWLVAVGATQVLSALVMRRLLPQMFAGILRPGLAILLVSVAGGLAAWSALQFVSGLAGLLIAGLVGMMTVTVLLWDIDRRLGIGLRSDLVRAFPQLSGLVQRVPVDG